MVKLNCAYCDYYQKCYRKEHKTFLAVCDKHTGNVTPVKSGNDISNKVFKVSQNGTNKVTYI